MKYGIEKRQDGWHVVDHQGYDVSYVSYDTKREAVEAFKVLKSEQAEIGVTIQL